jgi:hypothetical protein
MEGGEGRGAADSTDLGGRGGGGERGGRGIPSPPKLSVEEQRALILPICLTLKPSNRGG